jgi:hypothetical protein
LNASMKPYTNFNSITYKASIRKIKYVLKVFFSKPFTAPISIGLVGVLMTSIVSYVSQKLLCRN